ncbi:MAG TPA: hypothetical protein VIL49_10350 [Capillimicrobium sp.]|jgi:hypothetical protein
MGKRARKRAKAGAPREEPLKAPATVYAHPEHGELELRGAMTLKTRQAYAEIGGVREDAWQRQVEFLFERLAARWTIQGVPVERQGELLARFRVATRDERAWIRDALREHLAEHFPEMAAP